MCSYFICVFFYPHHLIPSLPLICSIFQPKLCTERTKGVKVLTKCVMYGVENFFSYQQFIGSLKQGKAKDLVIKNLLHFFFLIKPHCIK